ncbi:hypothetical protein N7471_004189 [Penicillium samsonianum]|uniref:uncharacterized protein n=1 Tax=Penicillium samsonianum TaxID=1882272 RepID=UPI002549B629|nr:uncharacterized protein N7471_004189 [Penicillium samsonianum]KAJ6137703.1 hypothetical protein N7471_004189 [Penicillium samsonianum]
MKVGSSPLTGLLGCPQEIIDAILAELRPNLASIASVTRVCRRLNSAATPNLYGSVIIWRPIHADRLARTIKGNPRLIPFIRMLQLHYRAIPHSMTNERHMAILVNTLSFESTIGKLPNLSSLVMKTDCFPNPVNLRLFRKPDNLSNLRSCEISIRLQPNLIELPSGSNDIPGSLGHDSSLWHRWILKPVDTAFFHSGLESLALSHCVIRGHRQNIPKNTPTRSTSLKSLMLLNCEISTSGLARLMEYPRALESFTFKGESRGNEEDMHQGYTRQMYVEALQAQSSSLEKLNLDIYMPWGKMINLTSFSVLKELTVTPSHLAGSRHGSEYLDHKTAPMRGLLPPSLEHLTFWDPRSGYYQHEDYSLYENSYLKFIIHVGANSRLLRDFCLWDVYRLIASGELPNLSHFTCVLAPPLPIGYYATSETVTARIRQEEEAFNARMFDTTRTFIEAFRELGVQLSLLHDELPVSKINDWASPRELNSHRSLVNRSTFW